MNSPERIETAVNGLGRIGVPFARIALDSSDLELVAINNGRHGARDAAKRLEFDSVHGWWRRGEVNNNDTSLLISGQEIPVDGFRSLEEARWSEHSDSLVVIESTGAFKTREDVQGHLDAGAKSVVITSPSKDPTIPTIVRGVNDSEEELDQLDTRVVSVSSCSTNCIAPVMNLFKKRLNAYGGLIAITHAYTNSQGILDSGGKGVTERRSASSIIPASSGSQKEVKRLVPGLDPFDIACKRVNNPDGSVATLFIKVTGSIATRNVIECLQDATQGTYKGIIDLSEDRMTADKVIGESASSVIDMGEIEVYPDGNNSIVRLDAWYDNEFGYTNRVADVARIVGRKLLSSS